jgi:Rrf2 family protein
MLSRKAKYGLKAMLRLASSPTPGPVLVADLAEMEQIPKKFLEQILLELRHRGLLQSKKGKGGGYMLGRPATRISMGEIVRALDGPLAPIPCVSQTAYIKCDECLDERTCGIRMLMKDVRDATASILDSRSLADIVGAIADAESRLEDEETSRVAASPSGRVTRLVPTGQISRAGRSARKAR